MASDANGSDWPRYFGDFSSTMTAFLTGETLVGMRARDIVRAVDLLAARNDVIREQIFGVGVEGGAIPLLHAAVMDERIRRVALDKMLVSYQSMVDNKIHRGAFENIVPGVLKVYDLPDLARMIAPRDIRIVDAANPVGQRVELDQVRKQYGSAKAIWRGAGDNASTLYGLGQQP